MTELQTVTMILLFAIILMIVALILIIAKKIEEQKSREGMIIDAGTETPLNTSNLRIVNAA